LVQFYRDRCAALFDPAIEREFGDLAESEPARQAEQSLAAESR
jgi:hypothetical protein